MRICTFLTVAAVMTAQETPSFRVNTRLVEVDVVVRSHDRPVLGLTKGDFRILDNGRPENIATFSIRSNASPSNSSRKKTPATPLPAGTFSNRVTSTGEEPVAATVILLDRLNTEVGDQAYFGRELRKYLATMQPGENVAIYSLLKRLQIVRDFTDDPQALNQAAAKSLAQHSSSLASSDESALKATVKSNLADPNDAAATALEALTNELATNAITEMEDAEKKTRALLTSSALKDISRHLRGLPGRKKLVWVSGGFPIGMLEVNSRHYDEYGEETARAVRALNNANVAVYAIDPRGLVASGTNPSIPTPNVSTGQSMFSQIQRPDPVGLDAPNIAAMNLLASGTGGRAFYASNDLVGALKATMEDDDVVYTLGFYPDDQKMDGAYHKLAIKVARGGVEVHHRQGYLAADTKVATGGQRRDAMSEAVQNPLDSTELGLQAAIRPVPERPGVYHLILSLNINELHLEHFKDRWIGAIDFGTHFSRTPELRGTLETIAITLTEKRLKEALATGLIMQRDINAGSDTGQLRVVIQDRATGSIGSVRVPIGIE